MTAFMKAVAVATAFSVEGVLGMMVGGRDWAGGGDWAGQERETVRKRVKYRRNLLIDGTI
jgi:hypothetical protein